MVKRGLGFCGVALIASSLCFAATLPGCAKSKRVAPTETIDPVLAREQATKAFNAGRDAQKNKEWEKAENHYRDSINFSSGIAGSWNNLGVVLMEQQDYMEAVPAFTMAANIAPTDPTPYENMGLVYFRAGYSVEAIDSYAKSLERDPSWLPSLRGGVASAKLLNRSDEATLEWCRRGLMVERDAKWRELFQSQRIRIENDLREKAELER